MRKIIFTLGLTALGFVSQAQQSTDLGFSLGHSNYLGDLRTNDYSYKLPGIALGVFVKQNINANFAVKGFFNYGRISGDDSKSYVQSQLERNLSFRSFIVEWGATAEVNVLPFDARNASKNGRRHFNFTPYIYGGVNVFHFNPKTFYHNQWIALQPLCTEGQNTSYNSQRQYHLTQIALPFGFGLKYQMTKKLTLALDFGFRKTFTDYLDDVSGNYTDMSKLLVEKGSLATALSYRGDEITGRELTTVYDGQQRGNSSNKDWYIMNTLSISYKLHSKRRW